MTSESKPVAALSSAQIKALKSRAHHLSPVVMIGAAGLTDAVMNELATALSAHELIKVRVNDGSRDERRAIMERICDHLAASPVQSIGRQLVVFRANPEATASNDGHLPKKLAAQGVKTMPARGKKAGKSGKAKAKPKKQSKNARSASSVRQGGSPGNRRTSQSASKRGT